MSAKSIWVMPDPDLPTRASPTPGLPTWARKPSVYSSPDNMAASSGWTDDKDEEIGSNGSIAGLFVEDDKKVCYKEIQINKWHRGPQHNLNFVITHTLY